MKNGKEPRRADPGLDKRPTPAIPPPAWPEGWVLYILECADGTLYTGITNDLARRVGQHNAGDGAKYTRTRRPVRLRYWESCLDRSGAGRRECAVKKLPRAKKQELVRAFKVKCAGKSLSRLPKLESGR